MAAKQQGGINAPRLHVNAISAGAQQQSGIAIIGVSWRRLAA